jgi:mono/diheme cytochrome c family protein
VKAFAVALLLGGLAARAGADPAASVSYLIHCAGCHLADASGSPPRVPDVRGEMGRLLAVAGGREYLIQVPGAATAPISDRELAAIVNYMLASFNASTLPASFEPFTETEVGRLRSNWLSDPERVRAKLLGTPAP